MNLEDLKKLPRACKECDWRGVKVWLRKLSAQDHLELFGRIKQESEAPRDYNADRLATVEFHLNIVSRSLCSESGELLAASDAAGVREFLIDGVSFDELIQLGDEVLAYSGYGVPEKKS